MQHERPEGTVGQAYRIVKPHAVILDSQFAPEEIGWFPAGTGADMDSIPVVSKPAGVDD
jgi:hypothetical protein